MPWKKTPDVAMYNGADWSSLVQQVSGSTPEQARRLALLNPDITFFFYCRQPMYLEPENGSPARQFQAGDAVFFSGEPWLGSAPQCDSYQKEPMVVVYANPQTPQELMALADDYLLPDGSPAIDVVALFAANYASGTLPYLRANNNNPPTTAPLNKGIQTVLNDGAAVSYLQSKGVTLLLTVLNGWAPVGWSQFTNPQDAQNFALYLKTEMVDQYNLDGIDIDDEYSKGTANDTSVVMVTSIMRELMPDKIISKALWDDQQDFGTTLEGRTLADNLTYGWEMTYYGDPASRLAPYLSLGLSKNQLCLGFSAEQRFADDWAEAGPQMQQVVQQGYEGAMIFDFDNQPAGPDILQAVLVNQTAADQAPVRAQGAA